MLKKIGIGIIISININSTYGGEEKHEEFTDLQKAALSAYWYGTSEHKNTPSSELLAIIFNTKSYIAIDDIPARLCPPFLKDITTKNPHICRKNPQNEWKRKILVLSNIFHKYDFLPLWLDILSHQGKEVFKFITVYAKFHKNDLFFFLHLYEFITFLNIFIIILSVTVIYDELLSFNVFYTILPILFTYICNQKYYPNRYFYSSGFAQICYGLLQSIPLVFLLACYFYEKSLFEVYVGFSICIFYILSVISYFMYLKTIPKNYNFWMCKFNALGVVRSLYLQESRIFNRKDILKILVKKIPSIPAAPKFFLPFSS